jgi:hypothetical protein
MGLDVAGVGAVAELATSVVNRLWPDKSEAEKQQLAAALTLVQGQLEINKAEAANPNLFVSGWRPYIGWICGTGLAYQFLVYPILVAFVPKIVQLDMGTLLTLLGGLLGLGAMRTVEKLNGVTK